jgi:hypothetical protein
MNMGSFTILGANLSHSGQKLELHFMYVFFAILMQNTIQGKEKKVAL